MTWIATPEVGAKYRVWVYNDQEFYDDSDLTGATDYGVMHLTAIHQDEREQWVYTFDVNGMQFVVAENDKLGIDVQLFIP